jgi:hypothetical protein
MPTYLCHGFRWQRRSVRVYVILQNLDDASPEWIIPARSSRCILKSFYEVFDFLPYCSPKLGRYTPTRQVNRDGSTSTEDRSQSRGRGRSQSPSTGQSRSQSRPTQRQLLPPVRGIADDSSSSSSNASSAEDEFAAQSWSAIKLLEEYDPRDLTAVSRPYAYVADYAVRIDLSCSIVDEIARYEQQQLQSSYPAISIPSRDSPAKGAGWFEQLRDQLQRGEEMRWYVVVNGDEVRDWSDEPTEQASAGAPEQGNAYQPQPGRPLATREQRQHHAQYIHQQLIFEGSDRRNGQGQGQGQEQGQQLALEGSDQQRKQEQEQSAERKKEEELQRERARAQQQQDQVRREQELRREQERLWRRKKERELEKERQLKRGQGEGRKKEEKEQQQQEPRLNAMDTDNKPPVVPEKDYHLPRPSTASTKASAPPLRPKTSFDAGASVRPKTPGSKGGGLRRLFGRAKTDVKP